MRLRTVVMLMTVIVGGAIAAPAVQASSITNGKPIYFVHGWQRGSNANCEQWNTMRQRFREWGASGGQRTVAYYHRDVGCNTNIAASGSHARHFGPSAPSGHSGSSHTNNARIEHLGYHLAWEIYERYSRSGTAVDVVAHSMGGLLIRYALMRVEQSHPDFPPYLRVEDVVTLGTPHGGARGFLPVTSKEVEQMGSGSELLTLLQRSGYEPDGRGGTDWTTIGSDDDTVVAADRAVGTDRDRNPISRYIGSSHKIWYTTQSDVEHSDYYRDDSTATTAQAFQSFGGQPFMNWPQTLWPVRRTYFSLALGSM